ncbi:MFS transporter [Kitasatospora cinereorecta]|uniref:MFS transporter n=1 Tax=Kitasatospora cinereorecta TaxID=285560 RepID=A0ABW0V6K7_9ACTN
MAPLASWLVSRGILLEPGPRRTLAVASFVNQLGGSAFMLSAALFYTRMVGLSVAQVGGGMAVSALVGLLAGVPVGRLADRRGPREVYLATLAVQAVAMASLALVRSFWLFVAVLCVVELAASATQASRGPLVRRLAGERPVRYRAYLRAVANLAGSLGALPVALAVQLDTRGAYLCLVLGNALSYLVTLAVVSRIPTLPPLRQPAGTGRWTALRDRPYLAVTVLDGLMSLQGDVLTFALPLWIVGHTGAPRWMVGTCVLLNTGLVVALQVRASRGVDSSTTAARVWRRSGWAFLAGTAVIALTGGALPGWAAALLLLLAVAVHTVGELWLAAGSFELRFSLAPAHAQGQYSGVFRLGSGLVGVASPSVLGLLCIGWGAPGWLLLGAGFVLAAAAMPPTVRWAERGRSGRPPLATAA